MADSTEKRITEEYFQTKIRPRITDKDRKIFRFIYSQRIVTSEQIYQLFYRSNKSKRTCNHRLKVLENLYCIKKFYPKTRNAGKSYAHIVLNRAGYRELGVDKYYRYKELPISYNHYILVNDFCMYAYRKGWRWGKLEFELNTCITDIWYPSKKIAVEIDTGSESRNLLDKKVKKYNSLNNLRLIIFISNNIDRSNYFIDKIYSVKGKIATVFDEQNDIIDIVTDRLY